MSEVQSRPSAPRGRGSARGGRAGFGGRGGRGGRTISSNSPEHASEPAVEENAEIAQLKKQYGGKVSMIKEMFPTWTDEDAVLALKECDGDLELAVERITDGTITQWGEVSKKTKDRSKSKAPESNTNNTLSSFNNASRPTRGGLDIRGGRGGRGSDRGGRGGRGRGGPIAPSAGNHTKPSAPLSVPTTDAWGSNTQKENEPATSDTPEAAGVVETVTETVKAAVTSIIPDGSKTWASIFKPAPAPPAPKLTPVEKAPEPQPEVAPEPENAEAPPAVEETMEAEAAPEPSKGEEKFDEPAVAQAPAPVPEVIEPSKDELTESNVEKVLDVSPPAASATAASTAASSWDPRSTSATPFSSLQAQSARPAPATSGFAATAQKAAGGASRTSSFQRRVLDQEEAVRMPGNREVDRAAVQFGAFNLGDDAEEDVDGDREEAETRAQPEHSPVSHPRASLPPGPAAASEGLPQPKEPQGLPSAPISAPGLPSPLPGAQSMAQQGSQGSHQYNQYGRYGQGAGQEHSAFGQKPYDAFSQQAPSAPSQYDGYPSQPSHGSQSQVGAFSSAPSEGYSQYYTADQQRYNNYYGSQYGQQSQQSQQEVPSAQRSFSGYNAPAAEAVSSQFPQTSSQTTQSRYATAGETQTSGNSTPNPPAQAQQTSTQTTTQPQQPHAAQAQGQQPGAGHYPYANPYYNSPYYSSMYGNSFQGYGQGNYGAGPYGKGAMYNQPQSYGMSPQAPYDHTPSPAAGAFGGSSLHGRDSAIGAGLGEYGRGASQQSHAAAQPIGGGPGYNSMDTFGRGSSYQGQSQQYGQGSQQGASDDLKPFGDSKTGNGPSPSLTQAARPGSAANTTPGQSALPPPQSTQQSYGGYPSHLQQQHNLHGSQTGSQYGGLGGLGGQHSSAQGHQSSQYGSYGQSGFGGNQYGGYGQQRGGWGNNYQH